MTTHYDTWKLGLNDPHFSEPTDYEAHKGLPYIWDERLRQWRDRETGMLVRAAVAESENDREIERREAREAMYAGSEW